MGFKLKKVFKSVAKAAVKNVAQNTIGSIKNFDLDRIGLNLLTGGQAGVFETGVETGSRGLGAVVSELSGGDKAEGGELGAAGEINRSKALDETLEERKRRGGTGRAGTILTSRSDAPSLI